MTEIKIELDKPTLRRLKKHARRAGLTTNSYLKQLLEGFVKVKEG